MLLTSENKDNPYVKNIENTLEINNVMLFESIDNLISNINDRLEINGTVTIRDFVWYQIIEELKLGIHPIEYLNDLLKDNRKAFDLKTLLDKLKSNNLNVTYMVIQGNSFVLKAIRQI